MDNQEQAQLATPEGVESQQAPAPELSITDLANLRAIVDLASKRGAFSGAELSAVGQVFDRLNTFLTSVTSAQPADATADQPADATEDTTADQTTEAPAA